MTISIKRLCAAVLLILTFGTGAAGAQDAEGEPILVTLPGDLNDEAKQAFLEALGALDRPVAVDEGAPAAATGGESDLAKAIGRLDDAIYGIVELPQAAADWWATLGPDFGSSAYTLLMILTALAVGALADVILARLLARLRRHCLDADPERFTARLGNALAWFGLQALAIAAFGFGAFLGAWLLLPSSPGALATFTVLLIAIVRARFFLMIGRLLFAPNRPGMRLVSMSDADALLVWRWLVMSVVAITVLQATLSIAAETLGITRAVGFLGLLAAVGVFGFRVAMFIGARAPIRALILASYGSGTGETSGTVRVFADTWHIVMSGFATLAFLVEVFSLLSLEVRGVGAVGALVFLILLPFVFGAWTGLIRDLMIDGAAGTRRAVIGGFVQTLGQGVILLASFALVGGGLGADPFAAEPGIEDRIAGGLFQAGAAVLVGWALWNGLRVLLEQYQSQPGDDEEAEDGMGKEGSRIETLIPVIRSFLLVTIIAITGMMALSALGVQIGPLLAGAGVIGLAIGFGAQTLVTDVITGLFYLIEDAFRKGEYIDCDAGKGVVERISIRSLQLRHHRGPLNTISFSKMGNVVNHSRDWVKIKFMLRVPFDTDLETVRKVIKRIGQDLQQDPTLGPMFLQPLKSQGVMEVDDSAFIIGVKFVSRPGEQFLIRREAYARIKHAFVENGIEFASRRVTVESEAEASPGAAAAALAPSVAAGD